MDINQITESLERINEIEAEQTKLMLEFSQTVRKIIFEIEKVATLNAESRNDGE